MIAAALLLASALAPQERTRALPAPDDPPPTLPTLTLRAARCTSTAGEVTICAAGPAQFRLPGPDSRFEPQPLRPSFSFPGGGSGEIQAVQRGVGGVSVPSAMVTLRIPLARKKK